MKENLNELNVFLTVVREGSFTRAAAKSGTSQSAISQTVTNLEKRLELKLLNRTTRSLTLTEAGERLVNLIGPALDNIIHGLEQLSELRDKPAATIRISADEYAIQQVLWPKLSPFLAHYPDINLELIANYGLVDIAKERYDAGVRRGGLIARDMIAIPISDEHKMVVVAAPELISSTSEPKTPRDLLSKTCINLQLPTHGENFPWVFIIDEQEQRLKVEGQLVFSSVNQVVQAAVDGFGYANVPKALVTDYLENGQLISVLESYTITYPPYHLYYTSRLQSSAAFQLLVKALRCH